MRLIDADRAIEYLKAHKKVAAEKNIILSADEDGIIEFLNDERFAIEAVPIKHCKPIRVGGSWVCSNCDWCLTSLLYDYCPYCGAKIDEVTK